MLYNKVENKRSIQTIVNNTSVIESFRMLSIPDTIEVRRMNSRVAPESQLFILTLKSDVERAADTATVKPLAEFALRGEKLRYIVKPKVQYPEIHLDESDVSKIEKSVANYMRTHFNNKKFDTSSATLESKKEWHLL